MILEANKKNLEWLLPRLSTAKRELSADGLTNIAFVLLTRNEDDRKRVESLIVRHFVEKYGMGLKMLAEIPLFRPSKVCSIFNFAEHNVTVVLIDIE